MREWMYMRLIDGLYNNEFIAGVQQFMEFCTSMATYNPDNPSVRCPCVKCRNKRILHPNKVMEHLLSKGFVEEYYQWRAHGETDEMFAALLFESRQFEGGPSNTYQPMTDNIEAPHIPQCDDFQNMRHMIYDGFSVNPNVDIGENEGPEHIDHFSEPPNDAAQRMYDMLDAANRPLYPGCDISQLAAATEMLSLKSKFRLTERGYDMISDFARRISHPHTILPKSFYDTRKLVEGLGLPFETIDCCRNHCMIYWGADAEYSSCKMCHHPRWKQGKTKLVPFSRMFYLPITQRLQRLYASKATASHMRWHSEHVPEDGVMRHPSDGEAWKHFDRAHPDFASDARNVRLGLSTDGFNPFGASGQQYSCWPVILTPYNLPPSMCMRDEVMFLTVIIPGPKSPKQRLDIYLQPLIMELQSLWHSGSVTYDMSKKQNFTMRAALIWTISDFPAYSMLSGWSTSGRYACPYCMENADAFYLRNGRKMCLFDCHRKFLPMDHRFRNNKTDFKKGVRVLIGAPPVRDGYELLRQIERLGLRKITEEGAEEHNARVSRDSGWKKKSIFWDLPYWVTLRVRHNLDVMHIEKNVFENIFNTVVNLPGKSKDNLKARMDIRDICKRPELEPDDTDSKYRKAGYTLEREQKKILFEWLKTVKFPDGYASNISRCIELKQLQMFGMKSHDCHVFMQRLLGVAFRPFLENKYWEPLAQLSAFFRDLTCYEMRTEIAHNLHAEIPIILCKLERIFPPSMFDSMEHLPVHLAMEAGICGPVQYRWMYPFERFLRRLKNTVGNKARVEGSICSAYIVQETSTFCGYYFNSHVANNQMSQGRNEDDGIDEGVDPNDLSIFTFRGRTLGRATRRQLTDQEYHVIQTYVLLNCAEVDPFVEYFLENIVRRAEPGITESVEQRYLELHFRNWFYEYANKSEQPMADNIQTLGRGPARVVRTFPGYVVNGYRFHTKSHSSTRATDSSGICVLGQTFGTGEEDYYGVLEEIIQLRYVSPTVKQITIFSCSWFDTNHRGGTRVHPQMKMVDVNRRRKMQTKDCYIFASQASQVYFLEYPKSRRQDGDWLAVCKLKSRVWSEESCESSDHRIRTVHEPFQQESTAVVRPIDDPVADVERQGPLHDPVGPVYTDQQGGDDDEDVNSEEELLLSDEDTEEEEEEEEL